MSGCDFQKKSFSVAVSNPKALDICEDCKSEITDVIRRSNGHVLCKTCFDVRHPPKADWTEPSSYINTEEWVPGWYEHLGPQPIYIHNKQELVRECEKRGLLARAFMKPKSQGKGYEHKI